MPRRVTVAVGVVSLLIAGLIVPTTVTQAQAGPGVSARNGGSPATTLAVIKIIDMAFGPSGVAVNSADDTIYVTNPGDFSVTVVNDDTVVSTIPVGNSPVGIAVHQRDDTIYVANTLSSTLSIIDGRTGGSRALDLGPSINPGGVAIDQSDDTVYVTSSRTPGTLIIIRDDTVVVTTAVGVNSVGVAVDQTDDTVFVANFGSPPGSPGDVAVISGATSTLDDTVAVAPQRPKAVAVNNADDTVYAVGDDTLSVISGRTSQVIGTIPLIGGSRTQANSGAVAVDQVDDTVYVGNWGPFGCGAGYLSVIASRTNQVVDTISVNACPLGLAVDDTGTNRGLVYVTNGVLNPNSGEPGSLSVIGRVSPSLGTTAGDAGTPVLVNVDAPQVAYDVDPDTVTSVSFGGSAVTPTPLAADAWQVTAPAGTPGATVAVTVTFRGGLTASAGTFTYNAPPPPSPVFPPSAPREVRAIVGDAQAQVTWTAPASSGSFPITTYEVRSTPAAGTCMVTEITCTINGLTNGTTYTFEARALNGAGWGPWSTPSNTITPTPPPPPPPPVTITITGSRGTGADRQVVFVTGTSTGLDGEQVRAHVKLRGQTTYRPGRLVGVTTDGTFTWQRTTGKKTYVYFTGASVQSNRVIIPAARR